LLMPLIWYIVMVFIQERNLRQGKVDKLPQPVLNFFKRYLPYSRFIALSLLGFIFLAAFFSGKGDAGSQIEFFRVKSCNSHLVRGKWWHVDFKEMPTMWQYKELEGKEKQKEVLSL